MGQNNVKSKGFFFFERNEKQLYKKIEFDKLAVMFSSSTKQKAVNMTKVGGWKER